MPRAGSCAGRLATLPLWLRWVLGAELLLPSLIVAVATREAVALAVPFLGPWAAWLYGHSCGLDQAAPFLSVGLAAFGIASLALAWRKRHPLALLPAALFWWPAWLATAGLSALNAHS